MIVLGERHLRAVLTEFAAYYYRDRPHRALALETPILSSSPVGSPIRSRPILGGLHHV